MPKFWAHCCVLLLRRPRLIPYGWLRTNKDKYLLIDRANQCKEQTGKQTRDWSSGLLPSGQESGGPIIILVLAWQTDRASSACCEAAARSASQAVQLKGERRQGCGHHKQLGVKLHSLAFAASHATLALEEIEPCRPAQD